MALAGLHQQPVDTFAFYDRRQVMSTSDEGVQTALALGGAVVPPHGGFYF